MGGTTVPKKLYYRIGEACRAVDIQPYVLRYWETEFDALAPGKSKSGQRVYTEEELGVIRRIKELLYEEGYTIAGAKKRLQSELEDGRVFGSPEVDGELFEEGDGEGEADGVLAVAVEAGSEAEPDGRDGAVAAAESGFVGERASVLELAPEPETAASLQAAPAPESAPSASPPRKSKARSKRQVAAAERVTIVADDAVESVAETSSPAVAVAAPAPEAQPAAVDSALSDRVETLEHGLRRVLAEVRHLRDLLG